MPSSKQSTKEMEKSLAGFAMFRDLGNPELTGLATIAVRQEVPKGQNILVEGDEAQGFYLVERGRVKVYKVSPDGKEHILHIIEAGFSFAEACIFFEQGICPASADAIEDSQLIFFPRGRFMEELKRSITLAMRMLGSMAGWVRLMAEEVAGLSLSTVEGRLVSYLVVLANRSQTPFSDGVTVTLDVEKGVLAARLGTIPETLSRTLKKLQDKDLLKVDRSHITILDSRGLLDMLQ
ncbi:MAG: Crp/Fnr family transcriptional regulator [Candidatus Eiseniibacteriota bacterium]|nr:MAG: Crp/Fnr family transcriptional regulator [Candidatus Eisenbacteria bacterium]